jgi:hypothetical protein
MLSRNDRIVRKAQLLEQLDPEGQVELPSTFTNHLADAIRASTLIEREQELDNALEAYEEALGGALYEILAKHITNEDSSTT